MKSDQQTPSSSSPRAGDDTSCTGNGNDKAILKKMKKKEIKRLLNAELKKEIVPLCIGSVAMLCSTFSNQAVPRLLGKVLDYNATKPSSNQTCPKNTYDMNYLLLIVIGGGISSFLRTTMLNRAQDGIASSLRSQLFKSLLIDRSVEWYQLDSQTEIKNKNMDDTDNSNNHDETKKTNQNNDDNTTTTKDDNHESTLSSRSPSAIQSILMKDVETVSSTITTTLANAFRSSCSIIFATKNMFDINRNLLSISIGIVPLIGSMAVILNKFVKKITGKYHAITEKAEEFATERIDHIAVVKTSNRQYDEVDHYNKMQTDARALSQKASLAKGMFMGFMFSSSSAALVWLFHIGGKSVSNGKMTFGELKTFATYTFMLGLGTSGLMKGLGQIMQGMVCAERIYDLISTANDDSGNIETNDRNATEEDKNASALNVEVDHDAVEKLSLSNVNFAYASDPSKVILKNISLSIERGEVVAIAGANGSGKSTIASLLVALYKPSSGIVTVDTNEEKVDLHLLDRRMQSSLVQLVPQNPVMFDMSIRENVTYANPNATENEIMDALTAANCDAFIAKLKDGINYNVGRNGCKLSGGQRQRLALARALLCDPALLILDEPNASMDAEGDNAVCDAVRNCRSGDEINSKKRGLLLITHKVTSLELADTIIVLKDGVIVEQGKYKDLVGNKDSALCHLMPDLQ